MGIFNRISVSMTRKMPNWLAATGLMLSLSASFWGCAGHKNPHQLPLTIKASQLKLQYDSNPNLQMVSLERFIPHLKTDQRYTTSNNFTGQVLYKEPGVFLRKAAAVPLKLVADSLAKLGLGILVYDGYRPYAATLKMWEIVPDDRYAANPANGSGHNRGIAVDLTLYNMATGDTLPMPTGFDDFTEKAHHNYQQLPAEVLANRATLKQIMEHFGFLSLPTEWWHFYLPEPKRYPLMDVSFSKLRKLL